ncbi:MBOAT family protein [Carboxylicivirga sp. A043]|uniref:MBOAT family O-acyltransferase n=1 Tax=Carboxylicivirga litoralis TaxID=2816963 RepID=UPI0021CB4328|nr:MBOAT family O-acyltransferase [Carboxylicivirga sp. A043]MCU4154833.1 MBOAT family protein [Carboxylicivirga sp. A043]
MEELLIKVFGQSDLFLFTHVAFWVFFGAILFFNVILQNVRPLRIAFLFFASLFFYYKTGGYFFSLLILSTIVDYSIGLAIYSTKTKLKRKLLLSLSIIINLSVLAYFKYTYFLTDLIAYITSTPINTVDYLANASNEVFGTSFSIDKITLPVGISFFTFQTISYSVDVYRKELKPVKNIIDFGFYVSFFPQLIAGPIVRAKQFIPQIYKRLVLSDKWIWWAALLIVGGLFKKMVISDFLSVNFVDRIFEHPISYSGFEIISAIYAYTLQIYCDFSGYTDIALGVALLLGFRLPKNFNHPYKATSLSDFWRRWHISLSSWLRDYLYIPLGGNRKGRVRTLFNLMITMLLGGLWHGAALKFIIWGALHGLGLMINHSINRVIKKNTRFIKSIGWFITFHFVVLTWIVFRVDSIQNVQIIFDRMRRAFMPYDIIDIINSMPYTFALILIGFTIHWLPDKFRSRIKLRFVKAPVLIKITLLSLAFYIIYSLHQSTLLPFIYFRF